MKRTPFIPGLAAAALALALAPVIVPALSGPAAAQGDLVWGSLRPGWETADGGRMAAIHLQLAPGWKTYWRAPGEAGIPPVFDWSGSDNLAGATVHWPRPEVFELNGMTTIGYGQELVLPVAFRAQEAGKPMRIEAAIELGVCREVCVPAVLHLSGDLGAAGGPDPLIRAALAAQPESGAAAGLSGIACGVEPIRDGLRIEARMQLPPTGGAETVVFEAGPGIWVGEAQARREGGLLVAAADMVGPDGRPFALDRSSVTVTVLGRDRAVEIKGCPGG
jgi:DsbC/DsbD-like thiol-disulfide interchange protein